MTTTVNNLLSENDAAYESKQNLKKKIPGLLDDTNSQTSEPMNQYKIKTSTENGGDQNIYQFAGGKRGTIFEEQNIKCSVEIKNGVPSRSFNSLKNNNTLVLHNYNGIVGLFIFLYDLIFCVDHGILTLQWIILYLSNGSDLSTYSDSIAISAVSILARAVIIIFHDKKLREAARNVNKKPVEKFIFNKRRKCFQLHDWQSIQTGDIIKIKQNQEIPCDALILDIQGSKNMNQTCFMRGGLWEDSRNPTSKCSYQGTMNKTGTHISDSKFVDQISGLLKWEYNHLGFFSGSFKQIDSPAAFDISQENILHRGCYFSQAQTIICLVLNVGNLCIGNNLRQDDTREGRIKHFIKQKKNFKVFESPYFYTLKVLQVCSILFCFLPVILMILEDLVLQNLSFNLFNVSMSLSQNVRNEPNTIAILKSKYWYTFAGFMSNLPYLAKLTMECTIYFHAYYTMWDVNLVPANINFNEIKVMKQMGQVDNIICSKSAFFNQTTIQVQSFKIGNQSFTNERSETHRFYSQFNNPREENKEHQYTSVMTNKNQNHNNQDDTASKESNGDSSEDEACEHIEYLPNQTIIDSHFQSHKATEALNPKQLNPSKKILKQQIEELLKSLVICHHAHPNKKGNSRESRQISYKSLYKDEEAQLQFADSFEFQFVQRKGRHIGISYRGIQEKYDEIIIRRLQFGNEILTIQAVKSAYSNSVQNNPLIIIYFKGRLALLKDFLIKDSQKNCEIEIEKYMSEGIHAYGIAKLEIDGEASGEFMRCISENLTAYKGKTNRNEKILMQYAQDLNLLGIWGLKYIINPRDSLVIEELKKNGVKLYILDQDDTSINITDCNTLEILEDYRQPLVISGNTDRQVEESLKSCLKQVVERKSQKIGPNDKKDLKDYQKRKYKPNNPKHDKAMQKKKVAQKQSQGPNNSANSKEIEDSMEFADKNLVMVNGKALQFVLKDETLLKLFLTLCNLSSLCIGSGINPYQKVMLTRAIKSFCHAGKQGSTMTIVSCPGDKFTISEADISIGLQQNYKQSDTLAMTDIQMKNTYGLTYLLFKHGTLAHCRTKVVLDEFIYRTILTMIVQLFLFVMSGFSYTVIYGKFFYPFFMAFLTPFQFWVEGITHCDYGYQIFHRIFGEYKHNQTQKLQLWSYLFVSLTAFFDACVFIAFYFMTSIADMDLQITNNDMAQVISWQSYVVLNGILLSMMHVFRNRAIRNSIQIFNVSQILFFLFSLAFVLEDENLSGVQMLFNCMNTLLFLLLVIIYLCLRLFIKLVIHVVYPYNMKKLEKYIAIEDRLFMEEYENPEQQFCVSNLSDFAQLSKSLDYQKMNSINQNLLKVHRTDSMDQIIDRLNAVTGQITNSSGYINKFTLKLNDINKELEYNTNNSSTKHVQHCIPQLWVSVLMYLALLLFKMINSIMEKNLMKEQLEKRYKEKNQTDIEVDDTPQEDLENDNEAKFSKGNTFSTAYFEITMIFITCIIIYSIRRFKSSKLNLVVYGLIISMNLLNISQFFIDQTNPLIKIQFVFTIAFSFGCRLSSFFFISCVCVFSSVIFLNINLSTIPSGDISKHSMMHQVWFTVTIVIYLFQWVYYTYWEEIKRKIYFVTQYRKVKEFQKLKAIINILIPSLVRSRIQEGKKNFSEAQGEVTIIFIDIEGFDQIVQTYSGRELVDLLDKVYNAFDQLCEQYGIQKIETVGKTYMACGGLKVCERDIDSRLLSSHHSVRVVDFASVVQSYVSTVQLKNGDKLSVKIGIHTGECISGVVGETKPQFSLIGASVNKTSRVCSKCPKNKILISRETHKELEGNSNNFAFQEMKVFMKGITKNNEQETVHIVSKRRANGYRFQAPEANLQRALIKRNNGRDNKTNGQMTKFEYGAKNFEDHQRIQQTPNDSANIQENNQLFENGGEFSQRSVDAYVGGHQTERKLIIQDESDVADESFNDTFDEGLHHIKYQDFKEDRQIVKSAAQNERYKLVERPRFLFQLDHKEQESKFFATQWSRNIRQEILSFCLKCIFDILIVQFMLFMIQDSQNYSLQLNIVAGIAHMILVLVLGSICYKCRTRKISFLITVHIIGYFISVFLLVACAPIYVRINGTSQSQNAALMRSQQFTLALYVMTVYSSKAISFRVFSIMISLMSIILIFQNYFYVQNKTIDMQTFIIDAILNVILAIFFIIMSYDREMRSRKEYNRERIIDVEYEKTEELLSKLVPQHVLQGIKNDQKVVDLLENVTLLYTDMVGFTEFSKNVSKPQDVVILLSRLFSKFDELCYQRKVYKVHTIGDCYVIMGYTGKIAKDRRTLAAQIEEAYKVVQVGLEMIEIITEEREKTDVPALKNLDMRIGIHTGRIVGGIIGTKVVRYDIFGPDVLIANKMESNGQAGAVVISETTHALLKKNQWIFDTLDMQEHRTVTVSSMNRTVKSYRVEQIFAANYSSSEEVVDEEDLEDEEYEAGYELHQEDAN